MYEIFILWSNGSSLTTTKHTFIDAVKLLEECSPPNPSQNIIDKITITKV